MSAKVLALVVLLALLILGIAIVRYRADVGTLPIDPHAAQEIEKAKRR
jgi:hypothetical protein